MIYDHASPNYKYDVFISYSRADWEWVWNKLVPRLEQTGLRVCIDDRNFIIGLPILKNIEQAVENSQIYDPRADARLAQQPVGRI